MCAVIKIILMHPKMSPTIMIRLGLASNAILILIYIDKFGGFSFNSIPKTTDKSTKMKYRLFYICIYFEKHIKI